MRIIILLLVLAPLAPFGSSEDVQLTTTNDNYMSLIAGKLS